MKIKLLSLIGFICAFIIVHAQAPSITYSGGPKVFSVGTAISPVSFVNNGGAITWGTVGFFAGSGIGGNINGNGTAARFNTPYEIVMDATGNFFVSDMANVCIRKITPGGDVTNFVSLSFLPIGMTIDASNNLFVAEYTKIYKITPAGVVTAFAGSGAPGSSDGTGTAASFKQITSLTIDNSGNIFAADKGNHTIRKITPSAVVTTFVGNNTAGYADGNGTSAIFNEPNCITIDASNNLYVTDKVNKKIRKIDASKTVTTLSITENGSAAVFNNLQAIEVGANSSIYYSDNGLLRVINAGLECETFCNLGGSVTQVMGLLYNTTTKNMMAVGYSSNRIYSVNTLGYTISPQLPNGLRIVPQTGVIFGTPLAVTPATVYTVTAANSSGSSSAAISIATPSSNNANLLSLVPSSGTLLPVFNANTTAYTVNVVLSVDSIQITPAVENFLANIQLQINGSSYAAITSGIASQKLPLNLGTNTINVKVTAQDGVTIKTYTITVNRVSNNADLATLALNNGTLSPAFASGNLFYTLNLNKAITSLIVTPAKSDANATIQIRNNNGAYTSINSGSPSSPVNLRNANVDTVDVKVTAHDGVTQQTYTIIVYRTPSITYSPVANVFGTNVPITPLTPVNTGGGITYASVRTVAGDGAAGATDGTGIGARFNSPNGIALDASGNVYVADANNNKIRKITPAGVVSTFAGSGVAGATDGNAATASFKGPIAVTVDAAGNVFVADATNNKIRKITQAGVVSTLAGDGLAGATDGAGATARFNLPAGLAVDASGNVFVADASNNKIRKITSGGVVSTFAGSGVAGAVDGTGTGASFSNPQGVGIDGSGNIYVADVSNRKIRKITSGGVVTTFAGSGAGGAIDSIALLATFSDPYTITFDAAGNVYVGEGNNRRIRKITLGGVVSTFAGNGQNGITDGTIIVARFGYPKGVAAEASGNVYVADVSNHKIRKVYNNGTYSISPALPAGLKIDAITGIISGTPLAVTTVTNYTVTATNPAGNSQYTISIATPLSNDANLSNFTGTVSGTAGSASIVLNPTFSSSVINYTSSCQYGHSALTITPTVSYPNATIQYQVNGGGFVSITSGNISSSIPLIMGDNTINIKVTAQDGVTTKTYTIVLNRASNDADLTALNFSDGILSPAFTPATYGYQLRLAGNVSQVTVTPFKTNYPYTSIKIRLNTGAYSTVSSGTPTQFPLNTSADQIEVWITAQDGVTIRQYFIYVYRMPIISFTNPSVSLNANNVIAPIPVVSTGGDVGYTYGTANTLAGSGAGASGDGTGLSASFNGPVAVTSDSAGNTYTVEFNNHAVRKITPQGVVTTFAGSTAFGSTDGTGTAARFYNPRGLAIDKNGNIYVADAANYKVRKITPLGVVTTIAGTGSGGSTDGPIATAQLGYLSGIAVDPTTGNVFVSESTNKIRLINLTTNTISTYAGSTTAGSNDGVGINASFAGPQGMVCDKLGNLYIADNGNHKIRKIDKLQNVTTLAGDGTSGYLNANGVNAKFYGPSSIAIDTTTGDLFVCDKGNNRIRKISSQLDVTLVCGTGTAGFIEGAMNSARFYAPWGIALVGSNRLSIADYSNNRVRNIPLLGYSVSPQLPAGLAFNESNATITGKPTTIMSATTYTVTALNSAGRDTATINITILPSNNANLSSLTINNGSLSPAFAASIIAYTDTVSNSTKTMKVTPVKQDVNATIQLQFNGGGYSAISSGSASQDLALNVGVNTIDVKVTAEDGTTIKIYTIAITRLPSSNASLSALSVSTGSISPVFSSGIVSYTTANAASTISSTTVTATLSDNTANMQVRINSGTYVNLASGNPSASLPLNVGTNTIDVKVTAQDGTTIKTYTITITRNPPPPDISYSVGGILQTYIVPNTITPLTPINTSGTVASYSISPGLPAGLSFNTLTGVISGAPTVASPETIYTIMATNVSGNSSTTVNISTEYPLPVITSFSQNSVCLGDVLTITGTNFYGITQVRIGDVPQAVFTVQSPTSIQVTVGKAKTGVVSLINETHTGTSSSNLIAGFVPDFNIYPSNFKLCGNNPRDVYTSMYFPNVTYTCSNGQSGSLISVSAPGTYTLTATDATGCSKTKSFTVSTYNSCDGYLELLSDSAIDYFNDTVDVRIKIKNAVDIFSVFAYLKFDATYLTFLDSKVGSFLGGSVISQPPVLVGDKINFGMSRQNGQPGVNGDGLVYEFRFVLKQLPAGVAYDKWFPNDYSLAFSLSNLSVFNTSGSGITPASYNIISLLSDTCHARYYVPVWPGDLNNDKKVNVGDLLPIGYFYGSTGPIRPEGNLLWKAQPAILWGYDISSKNASAYKTFADATPDGIIDLADQSPIGYNLSKVHARGIKDLQANTVKPRSFPTNMAAVNVSMPDTVIQSSSLPKTEQLTITVGSAAYPINNLYGLAFEIYFNPACVDIANISTNYSGTIFGTYGTTYTRIEDFSDIANGKLGIGLTRFNTTTITANGGQVVTVNLPLLASAPAGWFKVIAIPVGCNDKLGNEISITGSEDSLRIAGGNSSISGRCITPQLKTIKTATCLLKNVSSTLTDANGLYSFNSGIPVTGTVTLRPAKNNDISKNNGVGTLDIILTQRHLLGLTKFNSAYKIIAADVNGSNSVSNIDIILMKRLILGVDTTFTSTKGEKRLWAFVDSAYQFPDSTNPFPYKDSISFTNLSSSKINQSFIGVKLGDVDYTWNAAIPRSVNAKPVELQYSINDNPLMINDKLKTPNSQLLIPITVSDFNQLLGLQYTLHFDNDKYEFVNLEGFKNLRGFEYNAAQANATGNISMLWADSKAGAQTLEDGTELFTLVLRSKESGIRNWNAINNLQLTLNHSIAGIEAWDNNEQKHNIIITKKQIAANRVTNQLINILAIYPNPSKGEVNIETNNAKQLLITDYLGRIVYNSMANNQWAPVNRSQSINRKSPVLHLQLPRGIYFVKAICKEAEKVEKLVVE